MAGRVDAMMTCPLNKEAIHAAGYVDDIGHQEILARLTGATTTATMLMTPGLRVVHLSTHKSLIEAARFVTRDNVLAKLRLCHDTLDRWGIANARIAVAALNPHGGEGGLLGTEEIEAIAPAVEAARDLGVDATGPLPADSVFNRAIGGEFDAVLAMYHDQGHIAIKVHDFHRSIAPRSRPWRRRRAPPPMSLPGARGTHPPSRPPRPTPVSDVRSPRPPGIGAVRQATG